MYFDIDITPVNGIKIFTLTYESSLTKTCVRRYLFEFNNNGFHNGSEGQTIIYNKGNIKHLNDGYNYIKTDSLEDEKLLESVKNYLNNPKTGKYLEVSFVKLTKKELQNYSKKELRIIRNEIFARNGHIFISGGEMDKYFSTKNWYKKKKKVDLSELNEVEKYNVQIIKELEEE